MLTYKTPLCGLSWANIAGQGKLKFDPEKKLDKNDASSYIYTITGTITADEAEVMNKDFNKFWRENKPAGVTKQKYDLIKKELIPDLDADGKEQKDEDDAVIMKHTGKYTIVAKTNTVWPSGDANVVKVMRANKAPLNLGKKVIGLGSTGVIHGQLGISAFKGNEGLAFYLTAVQLKKFVEYVGGGEVNSEDLGEDEGMDDLDLDTAEDISQTDGPAV